MNTFWILSILFQWILLILLMVIVAGILRYLGRVEQILRPTMGQNVTKYAAGERIKAFTAYDIAGTAWSQDSMLASGRRSLLIFASHACQACEILFKQISSLPSGQVSAAGWSLYLFLQASEADTRRFSAENAWIAGNDIKLLVDKEGDIFREFGVRALPIGLAMDSTGRLVDQSINPHSGWLYDILDVAKPNPDGDAPGRAVPMIALRGNQV